MGRFVLLGSCFTGGRSEVTQEDGLSLVKYERYPSDLYLKQNGGPRLRFCYIESLPFLLRDLHIINLVSRFGKTQDFPKVSISIQRLNNSPP